MFVFRSAPPRPPPSLTCCDAASSTSNGVYELGSSDIDESDMDEYWGAFEVESDSDYEWVGPDSPGEEDDPIWTSEEEGGPEEGPAEEEEEEPEEGPAEEEEEEEDD